jgi:hypothetical protein
LTCLDRSYTLPDALFLGFSRRSKAWFKASMASFCVAVGRYA